MNGELDEKFDKRLGDGGTGKFSLLDQECDAVSV